LTVLALQILTIHYDHKKDEWKMIKTKSAKWMKSIKMAHEKKDALDDAEKKVKALVKASD